jgi:hypothetical protein
MPNEFVHIDLALRNQTTITYLLERKEQHSEWLATIAFYKALHIVEAIFAGNHFHSTNHESRERVLKKEKRYTEIWKHYRPLLSASMIARYLADNSKGTTYSNFSDYIPANEVEAQILHYRLHKIEESAKKFLSKASQEKLSSR